MSKVYLIEVYDSELDDAYLLHYVFKKRADAEEFALSLTEEKVYCSFIHAMYYQGFTPEQYLSYMKEIKDYSRFKTLECYLYLCTGVRYKVIEGVLL